MWEGKEEDGEVLFNVLYADKDYAKTFQLELKYGRFLASDEFSTDNTAVVINENAADIMGLKDPVGQILTVDELNLTIIGVVKDFHSSSLRRNIEPLVFAQISQLYYNMSIKFSSNYDPKIIQQVQEKWQAMYPEDIWEFQYFDNYIDDLYKADDRTFKLALSASWIAICIALLGLLGISGHTIQQKTKTICIRKILGAEILGLIVYLARRFIYLVLLANIIGLPLAYFAARKWLNSFAYHIDISWFYFLATLLISIVMSIAIISYYAYRTANQNPAAVLRNE